MENTPETAALVRSAQAGDKRAFEKLFALCTDAYSGMVRRYKQSHLGGVDSVHAAECDVVVGSKLLHVLGDPDLDPERFFNYMTKSVERALTDVGRARKRYSDRFREMPASPSGDTMEDSFVSPAQDQKLDIGVQDDLIKVTRRLRENLDEVSLENLSAFREHFSGQTQAETAKKLDLVKGTVKSRLGRVYEHLRKDELLAEAMRDLREGDKTPEQKEMVRDGMLKVIDRIIEEKQFEDKEIDPERSRHKRGHKINPPSGRIIHAPAADSPPIDAPITMEGREPVMPPHRRIVVRLRKREHDTETATAPFR